MTTHRIEGVLADMMQLGIFGNRLAPAIAIGSGEQLALLGFETRRADFSHKMNDRYGRDFERSRHSGRGAGAAARHLAHKRL